MAGGNQVTEDEGVIDFGLPETSGSGGSSTKPEGIGAGVAGAAAGQTVPVKGGRNGSLPPNGTDDVLDGEITSAALFERGSRQESKENTLDLSDVEG